MVALSQSVDNIMDLLNPGADAAGESQRNGFREASLQNSRIMIVDDEPYNILVARKFLAGLGYRNFVAISNSETVIETLRRQPPDVILLDIMMPKVSGLDILQVMHADPALRGIPVIVLTATVDTAVKTRALELGAADFLSKPLDPSDLAPRMRNVLAAKTHRDQLQAHLKQLEQQVSEQLRDLELSRQEVMTCLARAAEYRDDDTGQHVTRVGRYAAIIADELGFDRQAVEDLELAAQLHDVGKIGIPDAVLLKPGKLEPDEFELIQQHCKFGKNIIQPITDTDWGRLKRHTDIGGRILDGPSSPLLKLAAKIAQTHHEKWDGNGYPLGLAGEDIPIEGRITAVADVYDALSSARPYKKAFPRAKCFQILEEGRGTHFDPKVLDAFFNRSEDIIQVQLDCMNRD